MNYFAAFFIYDGLKQVGLGELGGPISDFAGH